LHCDIVEGASARLTIELRKSASGAGAAEASSGNAAIIILESIFCV
jgi:hypothetical protein